MGLIDKMEKIIDEATKLRQTPHGKSVDKDPKFTSKLQVALKDVVKKYMKSTDVIQISARALGTKNRAKTVTIGGPGGKTAQDLESTKKDIEKALKKHGIEIYGTGVIPGTKTYMFQVEPTGR